MHGGHFPGCPMVSSDELKPLQLGASAQHPREVWFSDARRESRRMSRGRNFPKIIPWSKKLRKKRIADESGRGRGAAGPARPPLQLFFFSSSDAAMNDTDSYT